jgi:hypothetical protein
MDAVLGTHRCRRASSGRSRVSWPEPGWGWRAGGRARWLLTGLFATAGLRVALPRRGPAWSAQPADRVSAVFCAVMCAALIAMTWRLEPAAATWLQAALFGCAALWFGLAGLTAPAGTGSPACLSFSIR